MDRRTAGIVAVKHFQIWKSQIQDSGRRPLRPNILFTQSPSPCSGPCQRYVRGRVL